MKSWKMITKVKLLFLLAFAAFVFAFIVPVGKTQTQVVTAGQKFKNIKVLNDLPADQLGPVMDVMAASLGVDCKMCHVSNEKDFDKDDIDHKDIARKMIKMTLEINKANFDGKPEVSCNTCHNGHERPASVAALYPLPRVERPKQPATRPTIDQLLEKYTAAVGGKGTAGSSSRRITAARIEANGTTTEPEEIWQKGAKSLTTTKYGEYLITEAFDGEKAWKKSNNEPIPLRRDEAEQIKRDSMIFGNPDLRSVYTRMDVRFLDRIDGRDVYMVQAATADNQRERLYFDAQTGFLVRRIASMPTIVGQFQYQVDYADFKDFAGVKLPTTIKFAIPALRWTRKILDVKNEAIADSKFS